MNSTAKHASQSKLLRLLGRVLIAAFCISILAFALPFQLRSPNWGVILSNRIVDEFPLVLAGIGLLRVSALNDAQEANDSDETDDTDALERDQGSRWISKLGLISVGLIAIWQVGLFFGILRDIDQQSASARLLQESRQALGNQPTKPNASPLQELRDNIQTQERISIKKTYESASQTKFRLTKDTARILLLCLVYGIALYGMATVF
jgi:hypothetical protein